MYIDYTIPPFIEISLPPAIVVPHILLLLIYAVILGLDFLLLQNEDHLHFTRLRVIIAFYHVLIPMIFTSKNAPLNLFYAAGPWFIVSYCLTLKKEELTIKKIYDHLTSLVTEETEGVTLTQIRCKGGSRLALGTLKLLFCSVFVEPLLPHHQEDALNYPWLHPYSLLYIILFGLKGYCYLGVLDIILGAEQVLTGLNLFDLFNSPLLATSPRDFWSRRWNKMVRNLLHALIFNKYKQNQKDPNKPTQLVKLPLPEAFEVNKTKTKKASAKNDVRVATKVTRSSARAIKSANTVDKKVPEENNKNSLPDTILTLNQGHSFWRTRRGAGLLSFIISGMFHELLIMSICRKITLEHLFFFTIEGLLVMIEVDIRQGALKQEPEGRRRFMCICLNLLSLSIVGRLFMGPLLRYQFFPS